MILPPRGSARRPGPRVPIVTAALDPARRLGRRSARVVLVAALAAVLSVAAACTRRSAPGSPMTPPPSVGQHPMGTAAEVYPATISFADGTLPELSYREFELPPGVNMTDRTERLAAYALNDPDFRHPVFGLLDLTSGVSRVVLRRGVNEARGYATLTPKLSDSWMAWEEVSPDETTDPNSSRWALYAARVDADRLALGKPILVDRGVTNYKLRPHYVVLGSTVYWSANMRPGPHQEDFPRSASICALDLSTGGRKVLRETDTSYPTLCAADGLLSATEIVSPMLAHRVRVLLIDPETGDLVLARDLNNNWRVSHFVRASRDWLAWAVQPADGSEWPSLYVAPRNQPASSTAGTLSRADVLMAGIESIDPAFFGQHLAFESVEISSGGGMGGLTSRARRIWVADLEHRTRSVLLETQDDRADGWWQTCASSRRTQGLLLWNDLGPWVENETEARTLVRLYAPAH